MNRQNQNVNWRVKLGFVLFVISLLWPVLLPVLPMLGVSAATTATIGGGMMVAAEGLLIAAAAISGKSGFLYIKSTIFGFLKSYGPPKEVSRIRYVIGLVLFVVPVLFGWLTPYLGEYLPGYGDSKVMYAVTLDLVLLSSLFVLGGTFWEKLRALFIHDAQVVFPDSAAGKIP